LNALQVALVALGEAVLHVLPRPLAVDLVPERPREHARQKERADEKDAARRPARDRVAGRRFRLAGRLRLTLYEFVSLRGFGHVNSPPRSKG
jgi:hypothetical protein